MPCTALFSFIGAEPNSGWLDGVAVDEHGFVLTDRALDLDSLGDEWTVTGRRPAALRDEPARAVRRRRPPVRIDQAGRRGRRRGLGRDPLGPRAPRAHGRHRGVLDAVALSPSTAVAAASPAGGQLGAGTSGTGGPSVSTSSSARVGSVDESKPTRTIVCWPGGSCWTRHEVEADGIAAGEAVHDDPVEVADRRTSSSVVPSTGARDVGHVDVDEDPPARLPALGPHRRAGVPDHPLGAVRQLVVGVGSAGQRQRRPRVVRSRARRQRAGAVALARARARAR